MGADAGGQINGVSLDSFLQMVQMERTTCTLTVKYKNQVGYLYILEGELIAAETGALKNIEAACKIISWDKSTIEIENSCNRTENEINQPLMNILMEGLRLRDDAIMKAKSRPRADQKGGAAKAAKKPSPPTPEDLQVEAVPEEISLSLDDLDLEISEEPFEEISLDFSEEPAADVKEKVLPGELSLEDLEITPSEDLSLELSLEPPEEPPSEDLSLDLTLEPLEEPPGAPVEKISPEPSAAPAGVPPAAEAPPAGPSPEPSMEAAPAPPDLIETVEKLEKKETSAPRYVPIKEKPKIDPRKKLKRKRIMVFSALGILVVIVAAGLLVSMRARKARQAEEAYQNVLAAAERQETLEEKISILQNFIDSNQNGAFAEPAGKKIVEIRKVYENQDFQKLVSRVDNLPMDDNFQKEAMAAYDQYLSKYPDGFRTAEVRRRISDIPSLVDDIDYKKLNAVAQSGIDERLAAYTLYLSGHPKGKHRKSVEQLIADLSETYYDALKKEMSACDAQQQWEKCIEMCTYFISTFKNHRKWDEMVVVRNEMQAKTDLANLLKMAKQESADEDYEAARRIYVSYLEKNPDSPVKDEIADELAVIDKKLVEKSEWQKVAALSRNGGYSVFDRQQVLRRFIASDPSGPFAREAKALLRQLETERLPGAGSSGSGTGQFATGSASGNVKVDTARILAEREKAAAQLKGVDRFVSNGDGTFTDSRTGLMWCILDSAIELGGCVDHQSAVKYVEGLTTGGHRDWRLPTSSDLAALYKSTPFFPGANSPWYWTSKTFVDGHHVKAGIVTSRKETVFKREFADVEECGAVRAVRP